MERIPVSRETAVPRARRRVRDREFVRELADELRVLDDAEARAVHTLLLGLSDDDPAADEEPTVNPHGWHRSREHRAPHLSEFADAWMLKGGKSPLLTSQQEVRLAHRVEQGDAHAREDLLNANVRLVASVARRYQNRGLPLEDLIQEGLIGLLRAIDKFNYRKGYRFSTYATHWIRQAVTRALANQSRSIRLPAHIVDAIGKVARTRDDLHHRLGRPPTRAEIAEAVGITEKKLASLLRSAVQPVSLEAPVGEEGDTRLGDFVPATEESSPSDHVFRYLVREEIERLLSTLTPRERDVIALRFGLGDDEPLTLEETGRRLHITRERARQIEYKALDKLRHSHSADRLLETVN